MLCYGENRSARLAGLEALHETVYCRVELPILTGSWPVAMQQPRDGNQQALYARQNDT